MYVLSGVQIVIDSVGLLQRDYLSENPWEERLPKLIWRGSLRQESRPLPAEFLARNMTIRARAARTALRYPDIMDIKFTTISSGAELDRELLGKYVGKYICFLSFPIGHGSPLLNL